MRHAIAILLLVCAACSRNLPELPRLSFDRYLPAVRDRIRDAYEDARRRPRDAAAAGRLGMLLQAHSQFEAAAQCYRRARQLDPGSIAWPYYLGVSQAQLGRTGEALVSLREAVKLDGAYAPAELRLADLLLADGKINDALARYQSLTERNPQMAAAWYGRGRALAAGGDWRRALPALEKASELFPAYGAAHYALSQGYRALGDAERSQAHVALYQAHQNSAPPPADRLIAAVAALNAGATDHLRQGAELEAAGRLQEAADAHLEALRVDPQLAQAHVNLIQLYARLGQPAKAEQHFRAAVQLNPGLADAHYNYGVMLFEQQRLDDARRQFKKSLEINPFSAKAQHNLGYLLERQGRLDDALQRYRKAIENRPDYRLAHFHAGRILVNRGRFLEAIEHFRKTLGPEDAETPGYLYALCAAYARAGHTGNALPYCRQAHERAAAHGQAPLAAAIERDIKILERR